MDLNESPSARVLQVGACIVVVAWGIRSAAHPISVVLIALLVAYINLPVVQWLMRRFGLGSGAGILCVVVLTVAAYSAFTLVLIYEGTQLSAKVPIYQERMGSFLASLAEFLNRHGYPATDTSIKNLLASGISAQQLGSLLPAAAGLLYDRITIAFLALLFGAKLLDDQSSFGRNLSPFGGEIQRFIAVCAKSGAVTATIDVLIYATMGVDFAAFWGVLYFLLSFVPNVGFVFAIAPPILLTLLVHGWVNAVVLLAAVLIAEVFGTYVYVIRPRLVKRAVQVSLLEVTLSLIFWGFLLGGAGAILGVPLTLTVRKLLREPGSEPATAVAAGG